METRELRGTFLIKKVAPDVGYGLFAMKPIKKDDFVLEYTGSRIPTKVADDLPSRYLFEVDDAWTIDGETESNDARWINHACEPNVEAIIENDRIMIYATRDIAPGEEILIDYGKEYFDEFIKPTGCRCSTCAVKSASQSGAAPTNPKGTQ